MSETLIDEPMNDSEYVQKCNHCTRVLVSKESQQLGSCVACRGKLTDKSDKSIISQKLSNWSSDNYINNSDFE